MSVWGRFSFVGRFFKVSQPAVSVIIPFYNVEKFLDSCVRSVLSQSLKDLEIFLVDDGSTDASPEIAASLASADPRVVVLTQSNSGPGGARNRGIAAARGRYLSFVDSDDLLPSNALKVLVQSADANEADISIGTIRRFDTSRSWIPEWAKDLHAKTRTGIRLEELPRLLRNNYPAGKVYRREFWLKQGLSFESGVIYEDQPLIAQMLLRATRLNVLPEIVYDYRRREDRSSISQRPEDIFDLRQRLRAWQRSLDILNQEASAKVLTAWYHTVYDTHLHWYLNNNAIADVDYWDILRSGLLYLRQHEPPSALQNLSSEKRVALLLLAVDMHEEFNEFRIARGYELDRHRFCAEPEGPEHLLPLSERARSLIPPEARQTRVSALTIRQQLLRGCWEEAALLRLSGHAYISGLSSAEDASIITIQARNQQTGETVDFPTEVINDLAMQPRNSLSHASYNGAAYEALIDVGAMVESSGCPSSGNWDLHVLVSTGPYTVSEPLRNLSAAGGLRELGARIINGQQRVRLVAGANRHVGLRLVTDEPFGLVDHVSLHDRQLRLVFQSSAKISQVEVKAEGLGVGQLARVRARSTGDYEAVIDVPHLLLEHAQLDMVSWVVRALTSSGKRHALVWEDGRRSPVPIGSGRLRAYGSAVGNLKLEEFPRGVVVLARIDAAQSQATVIKTTPCLSDEFVLEGFELGPIAIVAPDAAFDHSSQEHLSVVIDLSSMGLGISEGTYELRAKARDLNNDEYRIPVLLSAEALGQLPFVAADSSARWERIRGRRVGLRVAGHLD